MTLTPATFKGIREVMGLTIDETATRLKVSPVSVKKWESGARALSPGVITDMLEIKHRFDELVQQITDSTDVVLPRVETDGWPARSWRHAAILAHRYDLDDDGTSPIERRTAQKWRRIQGAPEAWRGLADWAAENRDDTRKAALITQSGRIVGEATRRYERSGTIYRATRETLDKWGLIGDAADDVAISIGKQVGERVAMVPVDDLLHGQ